MAIDIRKALLGQRLPADTSSVDERFGCGGCFLTDRDVSGGNETERENEGKVDAHGYQMQLDGRFFNWFSMGEREFDCGNGGRSLPCGVVTCV